MFDLLFLCIRPYIVNLLPYIARICRREEEAVQETLSNSMPKICSALMAFANDSEVKVRHLFLYTLLSLSGNLDRLTWVRLQQLQEQRYPVLRVPAGSCHVSVIHHNDMDDGVQDL